MPDPKSTPPRQPPRPQRDPTDPFAPARKSHDERLGIGQQPAFPDDPNAGARTDRTDDEAGQTQPQRPGQPPRNEP